jgi:hypothetical protein
MGLRHPSGKSKSQNSPRLSLAVQTRVLQILESSNLYFPWRAHILSVAWMVQLQKNSEGLSYSTELKNRRLSDTLRRLDKTSNDQTVVFFNLDALDFCSTFGFSRVRSL